MKQVLLVCGSGASSGFMAANLRKSVKSRGLGYSVKASSESNIEDYIDEVDAIMIGPHLAYMMDEIDEINQGDNVKKILMRPEYYATLDGDKALDHLLEELN